MAVVLRNWLDTGNVTMSTSAQPQSEVDMPSHGDLRGFLFEITASASGTLTGANPLAYAASQINVFDVNGRPVWIDIRGRDLDLLQQFRTGGHDITETSVSNSSATDSYFVPFRVDRSVQPLKMNVVIAPYSDMATSGATGGTARVKVASVYDDDPENKEVERLQRLQKSLTSGVNAVAPNLPKGRIVTASYFSVGSESNLTDVTFSRDGSIEIEQASVNNLTALDNATLKNGHVSGRFQIPHSPYVPSENSRLDYNMSGSDTLQLYVNMRDE